VLRCVSAGPNDRLGAFYCAWNREKKATTERGGHTVAVDRGRRGGISVGGILVIVGIVVALVWSLWLGIIIALIGLVAFGGFVRGKWY